MISLTVNKRNMSSIPIRNTIAVGVEGCPRIVFFNTVTFLTVIVNYLEKILFLIEASPFFYTLKISEGLF